jgi:hypothetical protein
MKASGKLEGSEKLEDISDRRAVISAYCSKVIFEFLQFWLQIL